METTAEKKEFRSKLLTAVVVVVLCVVFIVGFIWGLNSVLAMEGSYPPETDTHGIYNEPKSNEEVVTMLDTAVAAALEGKPKTVVRDEFDVDKDSIETDGNDNVKNTIRFAQKGFVDGINECLKNEETDFAQELKIRIPEINAEDIESFECKYFERDYVYRCDICDAESAELLNGCPECGSTNLYERKSREEYAVDIALKTSPSVLNANFEPRSDEEIRNLLGDKLDSVLDINSIDIEHTKATISFRINRKTGELTFLKYDKDFTVKSEVTFKNDFVSVGKANVSFNANEAVENEMTWPSLRLSEKEMIIEPKKTDNLTATLTCDDPTKPTVIWKSSDESVVAIDDEGYMKAGKEVGEAEITASFEFLGKVYTDTCVVSVRVPVESMKMSKRSLSLNVGETKELKATVSPSNATFKSAEWFTQDSSIATVDQNGVVTGVSSGTVTVYALSKDGYYKSSCEVTVK